MLSALLVVSNPLADFVPSLVVARSQFRAIRSEPLPVADRDAVNHVPLGPDAAVFVVLDVWPCREVLHSVLFSGHWFGQGTVDQGRRVSIGAGFRCFTERR